MRLVWVLPLVPEERIKVVIAARQEIVSDDPFAVDRLRKLESENLGIVFRLQQTHQGSDQ